jgi:carboxylesterase
MTPTPDDGWPPEGSEVVPGAEPWSADGGPHGALVLHGFTGNCHSMRPVAEALHAAGFAIEMPLLPGHGTRVEDLVETRWEDWYAAGEAALEHLDERVDRVVVVGLSMGGSLACLLAVEHPELAGLAVINPATRVDPEMRTAVEAMVADGEDFLPAIASDIAKEGVVESAYDQTPVAPLLSLFDAADHFQARLDRITSPLLVLTSRDDHVVPPTDSEHLVAAVAGPVEHVWLERSFHVATLDHDAEEVRARIVEFATKVTTGA